MTESSSINAGFADAVQDIVNGIAILFDLIKNNQTATILFVIGFILLLITMICIRKALVSDADQVAPWLKVFLFMCLIGSALSAASAAAISLKTPSIITHTTTAEMIDNLHSNKRVTHIMRLIAYDPISEPYLSIGKITHLGRESQQFTFVADYNELRGYTVAEAIRRTGGSYKPGQHVSAFIFPIPRGQALRPVNARGLLQVIRLAESSPVAQKKDFNRFDVDSRFMPKNGVDNSALISDLGSENISSYSWPAYNGYYTRYCEAALEFRCDPKYSARTLIGEISGDWHPLGFSRRYLPVQNACSNKEEAKLVCQTKEWKQAETSIKDYFGARAFLIPNMNITDIEGRYMIEFTQPETQIIPTIYTPDQ